MSYLPKRKHTTAGRHPDIRMPAAYEQPRRRLTRKRSTERQPPLAVHARHLLGTYPPMCASIHLAAQLAAPRRLHDGEPRETAQ